MAINSNMLKVNNLSATTTATNATGTGVAPDQRRLFNLSDRIAELAPEESPFFVYLSKTAPNFLLMILCSVISKIEQKLIIQVESFH